MKKSLLLIPVAATLLFAGQVTAKPEHAERGKQSAAKAHKKLNLTEQQMADLRAFKKQGTEDHSVFKQDLKELDKQLASVIKASDWDADAATQILQEKQKLLSQLALTRATNRNFMWTNLSEEQKEKMQSFKKRDAKKGTKRKAMRKFARLDLSDEQRQTIVGIMKQQKSDNQESIAAKKDYKKQEVQLIRSDNFDADAWQQLNSEQQELNLSLALAKAKGRHLIWNQLDETQQAKMEKMTKKRKGKMKKHAKNRM